MCFVLYVGSSKPLPRRKWDKNAPDLCVESLKERDDAVKTHFSNLEIQYVGSTSGCGCDFPHVILQKGEWPYFEDGETDPEQAAKDRHNREGLVTLLRGTGERVFEIYGIWDGDFTKEPQAREDLSLERLLDVDFRFKERGFYRVST